MSVPDRSRLGAAAEEMAAAYLKLRGCDLLARNVRVGGGEIDLIARKGEWILLIEVRYRARLDRGDPVETVCGRKARALSRAGRAWICRNRDGATCWRFDIVTVTVGPDGEARIRHYPGAVPIE
jgi:putative endonuclease